MILDGIVSALVDTLPLQERRDMWLQHDGAPPHYARATREFLDITFRTHWIGRGGPVPWPPRSPDLTPMDYFLWGYIKSKVYETPPTSQDDLKARITTACADIPGDVVQSALESVAYRAQMCLGEDGQHFEHLL
jgi:hypothetical protein